MPALQTAHGLDGDALHPLLGEILAARCGVIQLPSEATFDALIVGGGPAGSVCARVLTRANLRVAVLDREVFPREKLCGGWLSPAVWRVLELAPSDYPFGIWPWTRCHVRHGGALRAFAANGHFIRRYEFDEFLLRASGAEVVHHSVRRIERKQGLWLVDGRLAAPILVGAGGTHCPVARQIFSYDRRALVAAKEIEFVAGASAIAASRVGRDGEPELLLHDDLAGYSWNVPKGEWLNVGTGTSEPRELLRAWSTACEHFSGEGHVPEGSSPRLSSARGHAYHLFDPAHLADCEREGAVLAGDALGLAHPLTAEGILPAVLSGRLAGEAIAAADLQRYGRSLALHPVIRDYALAGELLAFGIALRSRLRNRSWALPRSKILARFSEAGAARAFAWLFSGRPIPHPFLWRMLLREAQRRGSAQVTKVSRKQEARP